MAYCDYTHCNICDCKAFYDAGVNWDTADTAQMAVLCSDCIKTHEILIRNKETGEVKAVELEWRFRNQEA